MGTPSSFPASRPAKQARELLRKALVSLQGSQASAPGIKKAAEHTAAATSALYGVENTASTLPASNAGIRIALEQLGAAIRVLQELEAEQELVHPATATLAHTLALLYPVARASLRQRRAVRLDEELDSRDIESLRTLAGVPPAPEPAGRPRRSSPPFQGKNNRTQGERVFVEADIGLISESHFYTGLSQDLSSGGVFVATYERKPPGTEVLLYFVLPNGYAAHAKGVVRWTRDASDDLPPGIGIAFQEIGSEDLRAIVAFCAGRSPLYHDSGDD